MTDAKHARAAPDEHRRTLVGLDGPDSSVETNPPPRFPRAVRTLDDEIPDRERIDALFEETRDFRTWQRDVFEPFRKQVLDDQALIKGGVLELVADMNETKRVAREAKTATEKEARASQADVFLTDLGKKTAEAGAQFVKGRADTALAVDRKARLGKVGIVIAAGTGAVAAFSALLLALVALVKGCSP